MIKNIIELLKTDNFYNISEEIEIAKGKYKGVETYREFKRAVKRRLKWKQ